MDKIAYMTVGLDISALVHRPGPSTRTLARVKRSDMGLRLYPYPVVEVHLCCGVREIAVPKSGPKIQVELDSSLREL